MERPRPEQERNHEWEELNAEFDLAFAILEDEEKRMAKLKRIVENMSMRLSLFVEQARQQPDAAKHDQIRAATERLMKFQTLLSTTEAEWLHWKETADGLMEKLEELE